MIIGQGKEPDSDVVGMLELSDQKFEATMMNMLRTQTEIVDEGLPWWSGG